MFGKKKKPRREIQLTCPFCGAGQTEPAIAISSFCRSCGEHFRIENGAAKAPPGARVSGIVPVYRDNGSKSGAESPPAGGGFSRENSLPSWQAAGPTRREPPADSREGGRGWLGEAREKKAETSRETRLPRHSNGGSKDYPVGARHGKFRQSMQEILEGIDGEPEAVEETVENAVLGAAAQPVEALKEGSMEALLGGVLEKMKIKEPAPAPEKSPTAAVPAKPRGEPEKRLVRCFKCNHQQWVSLSAASTQCGRCSVYISLEDHEITRPWIQNIRTRGDVVVTRRGSLVGCDVACDNLTVAGKISASVDCSGNAHFRHSGTVMGNMHCKQLIVDKRCQLDFPQGVIAESAEIHGTIVGDITCSGTIRIFKNGAVLGDAVARAVILKDGGVLTGNMSIQPDLVIELPEKKGYLDKVE